MNLAPCSSVIVIVLIRTRSPLSGIVRPLRYHRSVTGVVQSDVTSADRNRDDLETSDRSTVTDSGGFSVKLVRSAQDTRQGSFDQKVAGWYAETSRNAFFLRGRPGEFES